MKDTLRLTDISTAEGQMVSIDLKDIPDVEGLDLVKMPWRPVTDEQKAKVACILDEVCVLNIPKPQTPQEEEELVNRFLDGMRKLFSKENNWDFGMFVSMYYSEIIMNVNAVTVSQKTKF